MTPGLLLVMGPNENLEIYSTPESGPSNLESVYSVCIVSQAAPYYDIHLVLY